MTELRFGPIAAACALLSVASAGIASGHESHRKAATIATEATQNEPATQEESPSQVIETAIEHGPATDHVNAPKEEPAAKPHDHSAHESNVSADDMTESVSIADWLGRLHPVTIHFPIALFLAAFAAEILFALTQGEMFRHALRFCLWGGATSAAIAAPLGWMFAASGATEEGWILEAHRYSGTAALILGLAVLWIAERAEREERSRLLLRASLSIQALLIGSVGFLGGSLLYGFDHLWRGF